MALPRRADFQTRWRGAYYTAAGGGATRGRGNGLHGVEDFSCQEQQRVLGPGHHSFDAFYTDINYECCFIDVKTIDN